MSKNKIVACMLGTMLLLGNTIPILGSDGERPILTLDKAITQAKVMSRELDANERQEVLGKEEVDFAWLIGDYNGYQEKYSSQRYTQKVGTVLDDKLELVISELFDEIIVLEKEINILEKDIEIKEKEVKKQELLKQKGVSNDLELEGAKLAYKQAVDLEQKSLDQLELKYSELCTNIGSSNKKYQLQKEENIYTPYPERGSIDGWVNTLAKEHINIWKATEDIKVAELPIYTSDYMLYIRNKESIEQTKDKLESTQETLVQSIRQIYMQIRQLEAQYELLIDSIKIKEQQAKVNQNYFEKGLISQLDYNKSTNEVERTKLDLQKLINNHTYLKRQLNNPNLIKMGV